MFISPAFAQESASGGDMLTSFLPLILIFVVFYFLLIRPQQKRAKEHRAMLAAVRRGDRIVTAGGIIGVVTRARDTELTVEIADNVRVSVMRDMVASTLARTEPARNDKDEDDDEDEGSTEPTQQDNAPAAPKGKSEGLKGLLKR